jgi:hypothetical protein
VRAGELDERCDASANTDRKDKPADTVSRLEPVTNPVFAS